METINPPRQKTRSFSVRPLQSILLLRSVIMLISILFVNSGYSQAQVDSLVLTQIDSLIELEKEFFKKNQLEEAKEVLLIAENLVERHLKPDFKLYADYWDKLGVEWKRARLDLDKAEECFLNALEVRREGYGEESAEYARNLANLGGWYSWLGQFEKGEIQIVKAVKVKSLIFGNEHLETLKTYNYLGYIYFKVGNYDRAEKIFLEIIHQLAKDNKKFTPVYKSALTIIGRLYTKMGSINKGETFLLESLSLSKSSNDTLTEAFAGTLMSLGHNYRRKGDYKKAEYFFQKFLLLIKKKYGNEDHRYAIALSNLGMIYNHLGEKNIALSYHEEALQLLNKRLGNQHSNYLNVKTNLASIYFENGNYKKGIKALEESILDYEKVSGNQVFMISLRQFLIYMYMYLGDHEIAMELSHGCFFNIKRQLKNANGYLTEIELDRFIQTYCRTAIKQIQSLAIGKSSQNFSGLQYSIALDYKGLQLATSKSTLAYIFENKDSSILECFLDLQATQRKIAKEYQKPILKRRDMQYLSNKKETLEKQLARASATFRQQQAASKITHKEVQGALKPGEAAIEFVHFDYLNPERTDSVLYAAAILLPGKENAHFIPLFEEDQLYELLGKQETAQLGYEASLYGTPAEKSGNKLAKNKRGARRKEAPQAAPGDRLTPKSKKSNLHDLIWQPLDSLLQEVETIYYSPSGLLNRLNLGAISIDRKTRMQDQYQMRWLSSTRQLALEEDREESGGLTALIYGGIEYAYDSLSVAQRDTNDLAFSKSNYFDLTSRSLRGNSWDYLEGTAEESQKVHQLLIKNQYQANLITGFEATEESFKQIGIKGESPKVIHLATHGFFFPDPSEGGEPNPPGGVNEPVFKLSDNPMIRSGLIMAGANRAWQGEEPIEGMEDGILTSYEISQLNLTNTELVVLSACETGLGDIKGSEGVFGLQRAFKKAGVNYLIMSLWQVPDQETKEFMVTFYEYWLGDEMSIPEAFQATQQEMRKRYKDPYKWAGFVLME